MFQRKLLLTSILIIVCSYILSCNSFKGGQYYSYGENKLSSIKHFFYSNGYYESHFLAEGNRKILEKGRWEIAHNRIIVTIDSPTSTLNKFEYNSTPKREYQRRVFNKRKLFLNGNIENKKYKVVLKKIEDSLTIK